VIPPGCCEVVEVNKGLNYDPQMLHRSAEREGWILKGKITGGYMDKLMDIDEYESFCRHQGI